MAGTWQTPYLDPLDFNAKVLNETVISEAPDYVNPEFEAVEVPEAEGGEAEEEE